MAKRLIVCCDGTWNEPGAGRDTNVVKLSKAVSPSATDGRSQIVFYDRGVGTGDLLDRVLGGAMGHGLTQTVLDAYRFFAEHYEPDGELYLFGSSCGAYTARSTVGMIRNSGLLRADQLDQLREAHHLYRSRRVHPKDPEAIAFREQHSHQPRIKFLGLWDTVGSLGVPISRIRRWVLAVPGINRRYRDRYEFQDVELSSIVANAFHAVAIDEAPEGFEATLWTNPADADQRVEQLWFAGAHSDVGGGYRQVALSDLALWWMLEKAAECNLAFEREPLRGSTAPAFNGRLHDSRGSFYKWLPARVRRLGRATNEALSQPAQQRHEDPALDYAPANLVAYLRRRQDGRAS